MLIKQRIFISLLLLTLLPLAVVSILTEQVAKQSLQQAITHHFQELTQDKVDAIGHYFDERINETQLLAKNSDIIAAIQASNRRYQAMDKKDIMANIHRLDREWIASKGKSQLAETILANKLSQQLKQVQSRKPEVYGEMFVTDRFGTTVAMTRALSDYYQADEYWWQSGSSNTFLDDRGFDTSVGAIVIGVVIPVLDREQQPIGVFKINFKVRMILDIVSRDWLEPGHEISLVRSDGSIISTSQENNAKQLSAQEMHIINSREKNLWQGELHGKSIIASHYPMKYVFNSRKLKGAVAGVSGETTAEKKWYIIHKVDEAIAFSALQQLRKTSMFLGIIAFVLALFIAIVLSKSITNPLSVLKKGTEIIGSGNFSHRIIMQAKDEFSVMADSFNSMVQKLQETLASRDELNREITERKQAQKEMGRLRNYLNEVLDAMPSIVVGVDNSGIVTHWNRQAEVITNISAEQAIGQRVDDLLTMLSSHMSEILNAVSAGKKMKLSRLTYKDHHEHHHADVLIYPLATENIEGAVLRIDDVTQQTHLEEMMVQSEKMLSIGGLAGGMAHELNNPIGGMVQGMQNIRRRLSADLAKNIEAAAHVGINIEQLQQYFSVRGINQLMDVVSLAGERASSIVNNMLRFSLKSEMKYQLVKLNELLDETLMLAEVDYNLKKKYDFRNITIQRDYQSDLPPLNCIPGEIQQVLLNLLRNAAQALSEQSDRAEAANITLRTRQKGDQVYIEIADNGPGMDEKTRIRALEPFFTTKDPGQGTGLGLSVSYYIIHEQHDGELLVESTPDKGSNFIIQLPLSNSA